MTNRQVDTYRLFLPAPVEEAAVRSALTAIASTSGQPRVLLEASGVAGVIEWRLACERWAAGRVLGALRDHLPEIRHEATSTRARVNEAARVRFRGDPHLPLNDKVIEPTVRGLLGALSRARGSERVTLQLILGARRRPTSPPPDRRPEHRAAEAKLRQHRAECEVRIGASAVGPRRARSLIEGVAGGLRALEVPGVWMHLSSARVDDFVHGRSPFFWGNHLSMSDIVPLTGWPIGDLPLPGVSDPHPRLLPATAAIPKVGRVLGVSRLAPTREVAMSLDDSLRHLHLLGPTGVGKSTVMAQLALCDISAGLGVVVIDPKGDLIDDLLARIPAERHDDVVVLDARDAAPVGINGLHAPADPDLTADTLLSVFHSMYADSWGPRTQDILHACLLTLARRGDASLALIPSLLTNPGFRRSVVGRVVRDDPLGLGAFWGWFEGISDAERSQAIAPLMNKLRPVLLRPGLRGIFGQRQPRFNLDQVFTERKVLLVNLAKGQLGPEASTLLGSLVVALLWSAALRRAGTTAARRLPVMMHIDEVQDYLRLPGDLGDALAQARGLGVGFTLAHQHLGQLPSALRDAVLANARSRVALSLGARDARDVAALSAGQVAPEDLMALPAFEAYAALLVRNAPSPWLSLSTRPLPPALQPPDVIRRRSAHLYGKPLTDIEADLMSLANPQPRTSAESFGRTPRRIDEEAADD